MAYLWVIFECGKSHDAALSIEHRDGQVGSLNQFEDLRVGVHSIVHVVLAHLDQVNNLIAVVRVGASQDDALEIEVAPLDLLLLFIEFHVIRFHVFFRLNRNTKTTTFIFIIKKQIVMKFIYLPVTDYFSLI